ncbi:MAG: phage baseplate assembly protein V [Bacteroidales bacterium]
MIEKKLNKVSVEVIIDGQPCDFTTLSLSQTMFSHHEFTIQINYRAKEKDLWNRATEEILDYLGKSVSIQMKETEEIIINFKGIITKVDIGGTEGSQGIVEICGGSPTLLMTDDYSMDSFVDYDLKTIVYETINKIGLPIKSNIHPNNNSTIPYVCRYRESSYGFLQRLLTCCGEWFYYDGQCIMVGHPTKDQSNPDDIALSYREDLLRMTISSKMGNFNIEQFDYDPLRDKIEQWNSDTAPAGANSYTHTAVHQSKDLHKEHTILPCPIPVSDKTLFLMEQSVYANRQRKLCSGTIMEAATTTCKAALGKIITMSIYAQNQNDSSESGNQNLQEPCRFRVIEVHHTYDNNKGSYRNVLRCMDANSRYLPAEGSVHQIAISENSIRSAAMPAQNFSYPTATPEPATITANNDPLNLGRVQVKFLWQQLREHPQKKTSGWMRVQSPHAGSSSKIAKNRGFFFIPEVGDQVMVGYEYGDPSRPFVMGSLFHTNNTEGIALDNNQKTIRTRSGHTIDFNDHEQGDWGITVKDCNGSIFHIDTKKKNIEITAPQTITFSAKNIELKAQENIAVSAQGELNVHIVKDAVLGFKSNVQVRANENLFVSSNEYRNEAGTATLESDGKLILNGKTITKVAGKKVEIQGRTNKLELP